MATIVEGNPNAPFSIATTPRCRGGRYSFPGLYIYIYIYSGEKNGKVRKKKSYIFVIPQSFSNPRFTLQEFFCQKLHNKKVPDKCIFNDSE